MTTNVTRISLIPAACAAGIFVLFFSAASAQENSSTTATTTESIAATPVDTTEERWYKLETITGDIDVGDFVVGPGRIELTAEPGQTVVAYVSLTNRISDGRTFKLEVEDVEGSSDGSNAVKLTGTAPGPYSIRDFISFPDNELSLDLGQRARIPVYITVPENADPGGFYGSVLVSTVRNSQSVEGFANTPRSPIIARVGSLIFLTVEGDVERSGEATSLDLIGDSSWLTSGPVEMGIVFENTGSVHLNPYGELSVTNMFGEEVGYVELEPWFVLPRSLRVREVSWDREFLLGRYTATARVNRGVDDIVDEVAVSFWVIPWRFLIGAFLVIFITIFSIRAFVRTFEFKRRDS